MRQFESQCKKSWLIFWELKKLLTKKKKKKTLKPTWQQKQQCSFDERLQSQ